MKPSWVNKYVNLATNGDAEVWAHNSNFDRNVMEQVLHIKFPLASWRDTMVQAYSHGLPGSLAELGTVLGLDSDSAKLADGSKLVNRFCKPAPENHKADRYTKESHPAEWQRFIEYCAQDVAAMRECHARMPIWNYPGVGSDSSDKHKIWLDVETFSACDIKAAGGSRYARDETTEVLLLCMALDDEEPRVWDLTDVMEVAA